MRISDWSSDVCSSDLPWPQHAQHRADDRLDAILLRRIGERHGAIEAVAIGNRRRRKAELVRLLGYRLGIDRPFQHREGRKDAKGNETGMRQDRKSTRLKSSPCCASRMPSSA